MENRSKKIWPLIFILIVFVFVTGCDNKEEKKNTASTATAAVGTNQAPATPPAAGVPAPAVSNPVVSPAQPSPSAPTGTAANLSDMDDVVVIVDGSILKKSEVEKEFKEKIAAVKEKIPADKKKEAWLNMKKQRMEEFIARTLITNEAEKRKMEATDKEIDATINQIKKSLPPGKKLDAFMKENNISREYIALGVKAKKMVKQDLGKKAKPSKEEIAKFYEENKEQFTVPESAHVRHILVAFVAGDDDKIKAEKKVKIENLRKQVVEGADFAEVARKNSDCPSKEKGGDLGLIRKEQTVKPFEEAAFSQEINVIGPVVATEFGYHIIQVLERNAQKITPQEEVKGQITSHLEQQKETEAFTNLVKKLRENAKIIIFEN